MYSKINLFLLLFFIFIFSLFPEENLITATMKKDIDTSSYYELKNWSEKKGLDSTGTKKELRERLYKFYNIKPVGEDTTKDNLIIIRSAEKLKYINVEKVNENYVILSGKVHLEMRDKKNDSTHEILADKIIFNQSENTVTASGSITYTIKHKDSEEKFYGESLTFNVDSWEGMFFKGISEKTQKTEDSKTLFYFSGKEIYRKKNDKVIMVDGTVSSSLDKYPSYHLKASRIWVLNPGEWAIKEPVLFVGRIPVFAFPFIYMPGDSLVFHPIYGVADKKGYFINTTTYLIGQRKEENSNSLSFMQSGSSTGETLLVRKGIFLKKTNIPLEQTNLNYIKLLVDFYTKKGVFTGIKGNIEGNGALGKFSFFTGLGLSRYIFADTTYGFTPYYQNNDGNVDSFWQSVNFFGSEIPFRFGLNLDADIELDSLNLNFSLPLYSDPDFYADFMDRKENFGLKTLFENKNSSGTDQSNYSSMDSLLWELSFNWQPKIKYAEPYIQRLSIDRFTINVPLSSMDYTYSDLPSGVVMEDPMKFYYPRAYTFPDISGTLRGTIFFRESFKGKKNEDTKTPLKPPWKKNNKNKVQENRGEDAKEVISPPETGKDIPLYPVFNFKGIDDELSYTLKPKFIYSSYLNGTTPSVPENVLLEPDYSRSFFTGDFSLLYSMNISEKLIALNSKMNFKYNNAKHLNKSDTFTGDWDSLLENDKKSTNYSITLSNTVKSFPLTALPNYKDSYINYTNEEIVFKHFYNEEQKTYEDSYINWDSDYVKTHTIDFNAIFKPDTDYILGGVKVTLPPLEKEISPILKTAYGPFYSQFTTSLREKETEWELDPLSISGKFVFLETSYISELFSYDFNNNYSFSTTELMLKGNIFEFKESFMYDMFLKKPVKSATNLNIGVFQSSLLYETTKGYHFLPESGWVINEKEEFRPSKVSFGLNYTFKPVPFWKNRIQLDAGVNTSWSMNLLKPTDTLLTFKFEMNLQISEFLELSVKSESINRSMFLYSSLWTEQLGLNETLNPLSDLLKSFNFANIDDRRASNFNLNILDITAVHHLDSWDLDISYKGKPEIVNLDDGGKEYQWKSSFSIYLEWNPIPEIKKEVTVSDDEIGF